MMSDKSALVEEGPQEGVTDGVKEGATEGVPRESWDPFLFEWFWGLSLLR